MDNPSVVPEIGAQITGQELTVEASALGVGAQRVVGVVDGNFTSGSSTVVNWGPVLDSSQSQTFSIGASGFQEIHAENLEIGGQEIFGLQTTNNNCCCSENINCFGEQCSCDTSSCCEAIGGCCSSTFDPIGNCLRESGGDLCGWISNLFSDCDLGGLLSDCDLSCLDP